MPRRAGTNYIESDSERAITFIKRHNRVFKTAAELSICTGAKIAIAMECESGKMSAFGTPSAGPVIDSFLPRDVIEDVIANDEAHNAQIIDLHNELIELKNMRNVEDRRMREYMSRSREIQENSNTAKLIYGNIDDLSVDELSELHCGLSRVDQEIQGRLQLSSALLPSSASQVHGSQAADMPGPSGNI